MCEHIFLQNATKPETIGAKTIDMLELQASSLSLFFIFYK